MPDMAPIIVWFRQDLRLSDNPALAHAVASGQPVVCLYLLDDETPGDWAMAAIGIRVAATTAGLSNIFLII